MNEIMRLPLGITVNTDVREKRTLQQNNYYWGVVLKTLADATKPSSKAWHAYFKGKYIEAEMEEVNGTLVDVSDSTAVKDTKKFSKYLDEVILECQEMGFEIPPPTYFGLDI